MKTRAAVAFEAKKPLEIVEVDLEGPRFGEVLVEIKATGICHTDAYTLDGFDSEGLFPSILRPRRGWRSIRSRGGRHVSCPRRSRHPALYARMSSVQIMPVAQNKSLYFDPRDPRQGINARQFIAL